MLPMPMMLDLWIRQWLLEDLGRGDRTTDAILGNRLVLGQAELRLKQPGWVAGLPLLEQVFRQLDPNICAETYVQEGDFVADKTTIATLNGSLSAILKGERVALNLVMRLSGIATLTQQYVAQIADLPAQLADTRKTTPGLRSLEKYATAVGGAVNHRFGLDDAAMIKDNHIVAAGSIGAAIAEVRSTAPFPLAIEVETETLEQVAEAVAHQADIIMLDNMPTERMEAAVHYIRAQDPRIKIEASGNITLERIRTVAQTGVDFISTSAPITQAPWLDFSLTVLTKNEDC